MYKSQLIATIYKHTILKMLHKIYQAKEMLQEKKKIQINRKQ